MEVAVDNVGTLRRSMKIVLPEDYVAPKVAAAYKKLKKKVAIDGFRKGKVPQKVLEKSYGDQVKNEVSEELIQETYFDALAEVKLDAVVHPDIKTFDFAEDGSFKYEAEVEIKPEFELGRYKGIEVEHPEITVTDDEVNESLEMTRREMAPLKSINDRGARQDDLLIIDFQGYDNGEPMKNVAGAEYPIDIGSGKNGKEFESMVLGLKKGEEATREVNFPPDFANKVMAGKKVEFKISVKDVKERLLAELDDEFAKDVSEDFKTLDDLKSSIEEKIRKEKEKTMDGDLTDKIMLKLLESHDFELPARLVAYEIDQLVKELEANLDRQGMTLESAGMSREQIAQHYKGSAEKRVKGDFIIKKIAEDEKIKLSDEDVQQGFERISRQYGMPLDEVKKYFSKREDMLPFMSELLSEKILRFLKDETKVVFVAPVPESDDAHNVGQPEGE